MTNSRILMIGALVAVLAALLANGVQRLLSGGAEPASGQVVCAKAGLPAGHRLTEADLELRQAALGSGPKAASTDPRQLVGRMLAAAVRTGQVIRQDLLVVKGSGADIASQIPEGHRALTVVLRDPVAASSLFPGAVVDVLVTMDRGGAGSARETVTRVAAERARVLALTDDTSALRAAPAEGLTTGDRRPAPIKKIAVTLDVTAEQAADVELAGSRGTVGLAIRAESDMSSTRVSASSQDALGTPEAAPPSPTQTPAATAPRAATRSSAWEVIVIRGDERVRHDFPPRAGNSKP